MDWFWKSAQQQMGNTTENRNIETSKGKEGTQFGFVAFFFPTEPYDQTSYKLH